MTSSWQSTDMISLSYLQIMISTFFNDFTLSKFWRHLLLANSCAWKRLILSLPHYCFLILFNVNVFGVRAWIVTDQFCWIRLHFSGGGGGEESGGDYSREPINRGAAIIRGCHTYRESEQKATLKKGLKEVQTNQGQKELDRGLAARATR